ncbi:IS66 family insertion sequence element accessory protein TnpB, partial [Acidithiobacillus caldus]
KLAEDPASGQLFVFINRRRTQLKVLYFEQGGYCLWSKRLEAGRFYVDGRGGDRRMLSWTELKLIIEGIDLSSLRR